MKENSEARVLFFLENTFLFFRFGMMVTKMELGGNGDVTELGDVIAPGRFFFSTGRAG